MKEYFSGWQPYWPGALDTLQGILADTHMDSEKNYKIIPCGKGRVSDTLADVQDFTASKVILINAPTGSGKSTFVQKTLVEEAKKQNKYILFLCNRFTLNLQNKLQAGANSPQIGLTALSHITIIGRLLLCTYQNILDVLSNLENCLIDARLSMQPIDIGYVVFDEAHFFCSDATFNGKSSRIFREILTKYANKPRIYMTATMNDVRPLIIYEEQVLRVLLKQYGERGAQFWAFSHPLSFSEYYFEPDYSTIHLHFFSNWDSIKEAVEASDNKWLIFVSQSEQGRVLRQSIKNSKFINSDYVMEHQDIVVRMVEQEKFSEKVLIATSVFDSGINFKDDELGSIVVDSEDLVQITQMLGRKRRKADERVDLYVMLNGKDIIGQHLHSNRWLQDTIRAASVNPDGFLKKEWGNLDKNQQKLFDSLPTGQTVINAHALYQLALLEKSIRVYKPAHRTTKGTFFQSKFVSGLVKLTQAICSWKYPLVKIFR